MSLDDVLTLAVIGICLLLSAFFSGSETALTAASRPRLHELERRGRGRAGTVNYLLARKERLLGAILLGNNIVNIGASALATGLLIEAFGKSGVAYATIGMTLLVLIFSEVLPKTYAIHYPTRTALLVAPAMRAVVLVLSPIVHTVQVVVAMTLRIFGVRLVDQRTFTAAEEELRGAIELHRGPDHEIADERRMLRSILDLADVEVGEILTHRSRVDAINADAPATEIVAAVLGSPHTRIPVWREEPDNIVGVIHSKVLFRAVQAAGGDLSKIVIAEHWSPPWFIPEATSLLDQLREFRRRHEHFSLVVDEYGSLLGVVTLEDILEEIVGEIEDEQDRARPGIGIAGVRKEDGAYIVDGAVTIRDLNREFEWNLPDLEASTIAGLVMYEARRIPEVGQVFAFHGFRFEILRRRKNRILALRMQPLRTAAAEAEPDVGAEPEAPPPPQPH